MIILDTKFWKETFFGLFLFNQFHSPHFQNRVDGQDLGYWLYAQQRKQAQENYQMYILKDSLN